MTTKKISLLVCGSQKFEDRAFVFGMLNQLYQQTNHSITDIHTSEFAGACRYAREWVELTNSDLRDNKKIIHHNCTFDMHLATQNLSFYEEADLPEIIIRNDPFFQKGKELLGEKKVNVVLPFPNEQGIMGAATRNIQRFADLGGIRVLNCVEAYQLLKNFRNKVESSSDFDGLKNHHGMKR